MKVLHITSWYPNPRNPKEAIWIKAHIESISHFVEQELIHLQVKPDKKISYNKRRIPNGSQQIISLRTNKWFIIEIFSALLLLSTLLKARANGRFDIINFHIAYPNLTYWHLIKRLIKTPIVITEHWSAYHFNFGVKKPLPRIQRIFNQNIPVIAVSQALVQDIKHFSNCHFPYYVIPNVVDTNIFYPDSSIKRKPFFFMVSQWSSPKNPFIAMEAFLQFSITSSDFQLVIGGYGKEWDEMKTWIDTHNMTEKIKLVGVLESKEIANYLRTCTAFLHPSTYETFSVVCAEAISCNTPVIASNVGGIPEVLDTAGLLILEESKENWAKALHQSTKNNIKTKTNTSRFSKETIGFQYFTILKRIADEYKKK